MSERNSFLTKILIPENFNVNGFAKRLFLVGIIATGATVISSRNNSGDEVRNLIEKSRTQVALSSKGELAYVVKLDNKWNPFDELQTIDSEGNERVLFVAASKEVWENLTWSPDGKKLAFSFGSSSDGTNINNWNLFVIDTENLNNLTNPLSDSSSSFSDLKWIGNKILVNFSSGANIIVTP